jgi:hypothetical protein
MSFSLDLNGYYTYTSWSSLGDDGHTSFNMTVQPNGVIYGSGKDHPGPFVLSGVIINDEIRFVKMYTNSSTTWKYIGKRLPGAVGNVYQFAGAWGSVNSDRQDGQFAFSGIANGTPLPKHPVEGQWAGNYFYGSDTSTNQHRMALAVSLNPAVDYNAAGPFYIVGNGADDVGAFSIDGKVGSDGDWDVVKSYDGQNLSWNYQGRFDGSGTIAGIWRDVNNGTAGGPFTFFKEQKLDVGIAMRTMPKGGAFGVSGHSTLESALADASSAHNQGIAASAITALAKGFSS